MESLFVSRGRSVIVGDISHGPGAMLTLPADEAERLGALGFVQDAPPDLAAPAPLNPTGIGIQGMQAEGPRFTR